MIRPELHTVRRPFFDCTSIKKASSHVVHAPAEPLHMHAEVTRPLPTAVVRYNEIKVALRLAA